MTWFMTIFPRTAPARVLGKVEGAVIAELIG